METRTYTIKRSFELTEDEARSAAFYAAGRAVGTIVYNGGGDTITRVTIEPGPERPVWLEEWATSDEYDFFLGRLACARARNDRKHLSGHCDEARRHAKGRDAMEDVIRLWPAIIAVAHALLVYGDLSREQLLEILPGNFIADAKRIFESRFDRWYAA